ncbi:membrane protein insertion efficiency factor YidD [Micromonospora palomenae]|uniref:membrane protein insertion efficiency factor YidD n=1 Tax=Micromonospora palomenae TaxID=1461247 RepID=UPI0012B7F410
MAATRGAHDHLRGLRSRGQQRTHPALGAALGCGAILTLRSAPSCSVYAASAFARFGFWRGLALTIGRLWRCRTNVAWGTPNG